MKFIKYILILFNLLFLLIQAKCQDNSNQFIYKEAQVKNIKTYKFKYKHGKIKGKGKLIVSESYNRNGLLKESLYYGLRGRDVFRQLYCYDYLGNSINKFSYKYDTSYNIVEKKSKTKFGDMYYNLYDSSGNKIRIVWYYFGKTESNNFYKDTMKYNDKKQMIKSTRYMPNKEICFYFIFSYDSSGNLISKTRFQNNLPTDTWTYFYDSRGNCLKLVIYDHKKKEISRTTSTRYDNKNLIINRVSKPYPNKKEFFIKYVYEFY